MQPSENSHSCAFPAATIPATSSTVCVAPPYASAHFNRRRFSLSDGVTDAPATEQQNHQQHEDDDADDADATAAVVATVGRRSSRRPGHRTRMTTSRSISIRLIPMIHLHLGPGRQSRRHSSRRPRRRRSRRRRPFHRHVSVASAHLGVLRIDTGVVIVPCASCARWSWTIRGSDHSGKPAEPARPCIAGSLP